MKDHTIAINLDSYWMKLIPDFGDEIVKYVKSDTPTVTIFDEKNCNTPIDEDLDVTTAAKDLFYYVHNKYCDEYCNATDAGRHYMSFVLADGLDAYVALSCGMYTGSIPKTNENLFALRRMAYRLANAIRLTNTNCDVVFRYMPMSAAELGFNHDAIDNMRDEFNDYSHEYYVLRDLAIKRLELRTNHTNVEVKYFNNKDCKPWIIAVKAYSDIKFRIDVANRNKIALDEQFYSSCFHMVLQLMFNFYGMTPEVVLDEMYATGMIENKYVPIINDEANWMNKVFSRGYTGKRLDVATLDRLLPVDVHVDWR